jgi:hypothetical protein
MPANEDTARRAIDDLVKLGFLTRTRASKGNWYDLRFERIPAVYADQVRTPERLTVSPSKRPSRTSAVPSWRPRDPASLLDHDPASLLDKTGHPQTSNEEQHAAEKVHRPKGASAVDVITSSAATTVGRSKPRAKPPLEATPEPPRSSQPAGSRSSQPAGHIRPATDHVISAKAHKAIAAFYLATWNKEPQAWEWETFKTRWRMSMENGADGTKVERAFVDVINRVQGHSLKVAHPSKYIDAAIESELMGESSFERAKRKPDAYRPDFLPGFDDESVPF